jgi:hypothetical protein
LPHLPEVAHRLAPCLESHFNVRTISGIHAVPKCCITDRVFALSVAACLAIYTAGCTRESNRNAAPPRLPEASLSEQAQAVRDGRADTIRLDHTAVCDADLELLDGLEDKLLRVNLSRTSLTDAGLARLCRFERLEQLRVVSPDVTDAGLAPLKDLPHLRHLHLIGAPVSDAGLEHLHALSGLESLYLDGIRASDAAIARLIEALPKVHVHIDGGHHRTDHHADDHKHGSEK